MAKKKTTSRNFTKTKVKRIDLRRETDAGQAIILACDAMSLSKFNLAATFEQQGQLILIFQKLP